MNVFAKKRLGRGLAALIDDDQSASDNPLEGVRYVSIDQIIPNHLNPRRSFQEDELEELASSIRQKGILLPLLVRRSEGGAYEIIAGERRWRAAQKAGLKELPILLKNMTDLECLEIALIENIQRANLNPLEEAQGYKELVERFGYTQQQLSQSLGKSRSHIANMLRLLSLPKTVQDHVSQGRLSMGHARALITTENPEELAGRVVALGLSVRQTEHLVKQEPSPTKLPLQPQKPHEIKQLESQFSELFSCPATLKDHGSLGGTLTLKYRNIEQLHALIAHLSGVLS